MSVGTEDTGEMLPLRPSRRRVPHTQLRGQALIERVAELAAQGKTPTQIARIARIPYAHAATLYGEIFQRVFGRIQDSFTPEVLAAMKAELTEKLLNVIENTEKFVKKSLRRKRGANGEYESSPDTRAYAQMLTAIKIVNMMHGFNAPVATVTMDLSAYSVIDPNIQARILSDPRAAKAMLEFERVIEDYQGKPDQVVIDIPSDFDEGDDE